MNLKEISLIGFRNYHHIELTFNPRFNWFVGGNGEGKTNLLEAIYYLSTLSTFRSVNSDQDLVQWGQTGFGLTGRLAEGEREKTLDIAFTNEGKSVRINGKRVHKYVDILGLFPTVLFSPQDTAIAQGSPSVRRRWLDTLLKQISPQYHHLLFNYSRVLSQRNSLLRSIGLGKTSRRELEVWDKSIGELGSELTKYRLSFLKKIDPICAQLHAEVSDFREKLSLSYQLPFKIKEGSEISGDIIREQLQARLADELRIGHTLIGPHRDDIIMRVNGKDIRVFGSQGQQRSAVLSLKIAELKVLTDQLEGSPALLLDDVMSELDNNRREQLFHIMAGTGQVFVTTTSAEGSAFSQPATVYAVESGSIRRTEA